MLVGACGLFDPSTETVCVDESLCGPDARIVGDAASTPDAARDASSPDAAMDADGAASDCERDCPDGAMDAADAAMDADAAPGEDAAIDACGGCDGGQVCDQDAAECVECLGDDDCSAGVCDEDENACVECTENGDCSGTTPVCDTDENACVGCVDDDDCTDSFCEPTLQQCVFCHLDEHCDGDTPRCDTEQNECVECVEAADCDAASPVCSFDGECGPCAVDDDCASRTGTEACATAGPRAGQCVECTLSREDLCGGRVCVPDTESCHGSLTVDSKGVCETCSYDSECTNGDLALGSRTHRCVALDFDGAAQGGHCLKIAPGCQKPYGTIINAASLSGEAATDYCGINQNLTTCEAVLEFGADECSADDICGLDVGDGLCATIGGIDNICSYYCGDALECPGSRSCLCPDGSMDSCNVDEERYCQ